MRGSFISCLATLTFQVLKLSKWSLKSNFISITMFEKIFRVLPNGPIRSQNFVLIIFPRKFGPISAQSFVYILIFTENLTVILIFKKTSRLFLVIATSVGSPCFSVAWISRSLLLLSLLSAPPRALKEGSRSVLWAKGREFSLICQRSFSKT